MARNFWTIEPSYSVDTDELAASNDQCRFSATAWQGATEALLSAAQRLRNCWAVAIDHTSAVLLASALQAVEVAHAACSRVSQGVSELSDWRHQVRILYQGTEASTQTLFTSLLPGSALFHLGRQLGSDRFAVSRTGSLIRTISRNNPSGVATMLSVGGMYALSRRGVVPHQVWVRGYQGLVSTNGTTTKHSEATPFMWRATPPPPEVVPTPMSAKDTLELLSGEGKGASVKILRHQGPVGDSWSVLVPGTKEWEPGSANPQDLTSNLYEVGGRTSSAQNAVIGAMVLAGIKPGDPVEVVGHSQGGLVAASIMSNPALRSQFNFRSRLTVGGPVSGGSSGGRETLNLVDTADRVPGLGGDLPRGITVYVENPEPHSAHGLENYREIAGQVADESPEAARWEKRRIKELHLGKATTTTAYSFTSKRLSMADLI